MAYKPDETLKLTRKLLMSLPEGLYRVSNLTDDACGPLYEGVVAELGVRDMQWEKIKQCGADQRHGHVFDTKEEYVRRYGRIENTPLNTWGGAADVSRPDIG